MEGAGRGEEGVVVVEETRSEHGEVAADYGLVDCFDCPAVPGGPLEGVRKNGYSGLEERDVPLVLRLPKRLEFGV